MNLKRFLVAGVCLCCLAGSLSAQVFSPNAVGYVNVTLKPGFNLVSNPLIAEDNTISSLFRNFQTGVLPGTTIYKLINGTFLTCTWDDLDQTYVGSATAEETLPGDGVFVFLPGSTEKVLTFVGYVPQGALCVDIPRGYSIKSSVIPQSINLLNAGFPATSGDVVYRLNRTSPGYTAYMFDDLSLSWHPAPPHLFVGEAFLLYHPGPPTTWCRTFYVNNPF